MSQLPRPIVIVEDDPDLREAIHALLADEGYRVITAPDCSTALAALSDHENPCIVMLDLLTSRLRGERSLRELQRLLAERRIPIILATTQPEERDLLGVGARVVLRKPFKLDALLGTIEDSCG